MRTRWTWGRSACCRWAAAVLPALPCDGEVRTGPDATPSLAPQLASPYRNERLRAVGFDDRAILQITLIASWFNYINRVADALGVGREGPP